MQPDAHRSAEAGNAREISRTRHGQHHLIGQRGGIRLAGMLFVLCGEKAAWQGVQLHLRLIVNILDIEAGEEGFGQRKDDV